MRQTPHYGWTLPYPLQVPWHQTVASVMQAAHAKVGSHNQTRVPRCTTAFAKVPDFNTPFAGPQRQNTFSTVSLICLGGPIVGSFAVACSGSQLATRLFASGIQIDVVPAVEYPYPGYLRLLLWGIGATTAASWYAWGDSGRLVYQGDRSNCGLAFTEVFSAGPGTYGVTLQWNPGSDGYTGWLLGGTATLLVEER